MAAYECAKIDSDDYTVYPLAAGVDTINNGKLLKYISPANAQERYKKALAKEAAKADTSSSVDTSSNNNTGGENTGSNNNTGGENTGAGENTGSNETQNPQNP
jgi:hypothetical protein